MQAFRRLGPRIVPFVKNPHNRPSNKQSRFLFFPVSLSLSLSFSLAHFVSLSFRSSCASSSVPFSTGAQRCNNAVQTPCRQAPPLSFLFKRAEREKEREREREKTPLSGKSVCCFLRGPVQKLTRLSVAVEWGDKGAHLLLLLNADRRGPSSVCCRRSVCVPVCREAHAPILPVRAARKPFTIGSTTSDEHPQILGSGVLHQYTRITSWKRERQRRTMKNGYR